MMREEQIRKSVYGREDKYTTDDYVKSITALEIEYGALSENYGELNHCVICFREPVVHMLDGKEKELYVEHVEEGKRKLAALKERIKRDLGDDDRLLTYSCTWDKSARKLVKFTTNGQPLENVLTNCFLELFQDDWREYENLSWQNKEQLAFRALMDNTLRSFTGRMQDVYSCYNQAVRGTGPIILRGEAGYGKTAIMCKIIESLQKDGKNVFVFFAGEGSKSDTAISLVKQMVYYVEKLLGEEHLEEDESNYRKINSEFSKVLYSSEKENQYYVWLERLRRLCFHLTEKEKVFFCIDALDQLFFDEYASEMDFFLREKGVQIIISLNDDFIFPERFMIDWNISIHKMSYLNWEDIILVIRRIFESYSRNVYVAIENEILKKKSIFEPLYISLLIKRLNMMDMEELGDAMTEDEIITLGTSIIRDMPDETEDAVRAVIQKGLEKLSGRREELQEAIAYLAVSRNGLRMHDLQEIFKLLKKELVVLDFTLLIKYFDDLFYMHEDDRIDFTHKLIRRGIIKGVVDREEKVRVINEYLKSLDSRDILRMQAGMYCARIIEDEEFAVELIKEAYDKKEGVLIRSIRKEALEDGGEFYCKLIDKENTENSKVLQFFVSAFWEKWRLVKEEIDAIFTIEEKLEICLEKAYEENGKIDRLQDLIILYSNMGNVLNGIGKTKEALLFFDKLRKCKERLYQQFNVHGKENGLLYIK